MSLAAKTASGAAWHLGAGVAVRALGLVGTLLLTRFLAPKDYGEVLLAAACVITAARFIVLGLSTYVIAHRSPPGEVFQAMVLHLGLNALAAALVTLLRNPLAAALGAPGMARYVPGMALALLLASIAQVPSATMARSLRFGVPAVARVAGEAAYTVVSVGLAPIIGGAAIVAGNLARSVLSSCLVLLRSDRSDWWRPTRLQWATAKRQLAFGLPLTGSAVAGAVSGYGDNLLVSRLYGPAVMGHYNLAFNLATTPTAYVADYAGDVLLSGLSAVGDDARRRQAFLRALAVVPLLVFPLAFGLAVVSPTLVAVLLDPRWAPVAPMLTILSGISVARTVASVTGPYLLSSRRPQVILIIGWLRAISLVTLILTLGRLGPLWVCVAAALAAGLECAGSLLAASREEGLTLSSLVTAFAPAFLASSVMVAGVLAARELLRGLAPPGWLALVVEVGLGVLFYGAAASLLARRHVRDVLGILREVVARRPPATAETA